MSVSLIVSSRAPVWGASVQSLDLSSGQACFKSCPRVGGILLPDDTTVPDSGFKSCPRVGGIQKLKHQTQNQQGFKSCPRVGGIFLPDDTTVPDSGFKSCPRVGGIFSGAD